MSHTALMGVITIALCVGNAQTLEGQSLPTPALAIAGHSIRVAVTPDAPASTLKAIDAITIPVVVEFPAGLTIATVVAGEYGSRRRGLLELFWRRNEELLKQLRALNPAAPEAVPLPEKTSVSLPSIPRLRTWKPITSPVSAVIDPARSSIRTSSTLPHRARRS